MISGSRSRRIDGREGEWRRPPRRYNISITMAIPLKIRKVGNSAGLTLPKEVLARLRVEVGDTVYLIESPDGFALSPYDDTFEDGMKAFERTRRKFRNALRELAK
jgi:putative addiction module antidote